jgi:hypothetical protein
VATDLELLNQLTESIKGRTLDINDAFLKVSANSDDLIGKLAKLSTTSERLGAAWSVVTRATEAVMPGVSKFLFSARSIAYYAKFAEVSRKAEAKKQKEILDTVKDNLSIQKSAQELITQINLARDDGATLIARENILMNDQVQLLVKLNGEEKGLRKAKAKSLDILEKTYKVEQNLNKEVFEESFKRGERLGFVKKNRFRIPLDQGVRKRDQGLVGQFLENTFNTDLLKRMRGLEKERNEIIKESVKTGEGKSLKDAVLKTGRQREKALYKLTSLTDPVDIQKQEEVIADLQTRLDNQHRALREFMSEQTKLHDEHIDRLDEDIKAQKENARAQKEILERRGYKVKTEGGNISVRRRSALGNMFGGGRSARELYGDDASSIKSVFENSEVLQGLATPFLPVIKGVKGLVDVAKLVKPALGMLKTFLGQAIKFFAGAILAVAAIAFGVFLLKKSGVIDKIVVFMKEIWPAIKSAGETALEKIIKMATNLFKLAGYYWDLISALFSGNEEKAREALSNIWNWAKQAWRNFIDNTLPILFDFITNTLPNVLINGIKTALGIEGSITDALGEATGAVEHSQYENKRNIGKLALSIQYGMKEARQGEHGEGAQLYARTFGHVASGISSLVSGESIVGLASGGPAKGLTLVGELGPELVRLPGGSMVYNNANTRGMMGNTINVHVNGRVGASEQELNDLARRIGEKINREMNRFGGLGIRA